MLKSEIFLSKILDKTSLQRKVHFWRFKDLKIVFTNGCFDLIHQGHIHLLTKAADLGDILIVGVNTDSSVKSLKGKSRPFLNESTRTSILASMFYVDAVVLFEESTPKHLIELVSPDCLVKGGDYTKEDVVGADWVLQHGGRVEIIKFLEGHSTTFIEQKISQHH